MKDQTFQLKIYSPFKTYFEGPAASLSAINQTGPFDVLPHHQRFMSLLNRCTIKVRVPKNENVNLPIERGIIHVKEDKVTVFLDV